MDALIERAEQSDLQKILDLQYLAYQSEARLFNDKNIPPLTQTLDDLEREFCAGIILKAVRDDEIIGSVRGRVDAGTTYVGKLIVHPQCQGHGLGTRLLLAIEQHCATERYIVWDADTDAPQHRVTVNQRNGVDTEERIKQFKAWFEDYLY